MSKHLDWSRITPDVAVWCQTAAEDLDFRQACEERGMMWKCLDKPTEHNYFDLSGCGGSQFEVDGMVLMRDDIGKPRIPYSDLLVEDKPRICEILGVEVEEQFRVVDKEYGYDSVWMKIDEYGVARGAETKHKTEAVHVLALHAINHPDCIIRKPRFTPDDLAMLRCFAEAGVVSIKRGDHGELLTDAGDYGGPLWPSTLLPSLQHGESITLSEVLK